MYNYYVCSFFFLERGIVRTVYVRSQGRYITKYISRKMYVRRQQVCVFLAGHTAVSTSRWSCFVESPITQIHLSYQSVCGVVNMIAVNLDD